MSSAYAMIESGTVTNVVLWDGPGVEVEPDAHGAEVTAWQPPEGAEMFPVTEETGPAYIGGTYVDGKFVAPPTPPAPPPTAAQVLAQRDGLLAEATRRIAPLQDAVDLDDATADETALLKAWKQYRVALNRVEQQSGFLANVDWPKAPA